MKILYNSEKSRNYWITFIDGEMKIKFPISTYKKRALSEKKLNTSRG